MAKTSKELKAPKTTKIKIPELKRSNSFTVTFKDFEGNQFPNNAHFDCNVLSISGMNAKVFPEDTGMVYGGQILITDDEDNHVADFLSRLMTEKLVRLEVVYRNDKFQELRHIEFVDFELETVEMSELSVIDSSAATMTIHFNHRGVRDVK